MKTQYISINIKRYLDINFCFNVLKDGRIFIDYNFSFSKLDVTGVKLKFYVKF